MTDENPDHAAVPGAGFAPKHEVRALTGLRGIAALDVMLGHYNIHNNPTVHLFVFSDASVDIFFCLSSFTLCLVYLSGGKRFNAYDYAVARFARIYPLFALMMAICLYMGIAWGSEDFPVLSDAFIVKHTLAQFLLLAALPVKSLSGSWNIAAWSVSIEAVCYVAFFPLIVAFWPRILRASPRLLPVAMFACVLYGHFFFLRYYNPVVNGLIFPPPPNNMAYWVALVRGATMFASGALAFALFESNHDMRRAAGLMTDTTMLLIIVINAAEPLGFINRHAMVVLAPLLIMGLMDSRSVTARLLASRPLHFLGVISYSVYLLHLLIIIIVFHLHPSIAGAGSLVMIVPLILTLICATISYYCFEAPARRLIRWL